MKVVFTGNLSFQNQLPRVLQRIHEEPCPGLTALHLTDRQAKKEGVIYISNSRYVCGAVFADIPFDPTQPPLLQGYDALKALTSLLLPEFELLSEISNDLPNPDLSLNIKLSALIALLPSLPENVTDLNVNLMDRVFENSTNTNMPAAVMNEYLTEAAEATAEISTIESNLQNNSDLPPAEYGEAYAHPAPERHYVSLQELAALEMEQGLLVMPPKLTVADRVRAFIGAVIQFMRANSAVFAVVLIVMAVFTVGSVYLKQTRAHPSNPEPVAKKPSKTPHKTKTAP